jgi:hypothetical protein
MKMVRHQNKTQNRAIEAARRRIQQFHKARPVPLVKEDPLPGIAARTSVIDRIVKLHPQRPSHAAALPVQPHECQMFRFDPTAPCIKSALPLC